MTTDASLRWTGCEELVTVATRAVRRAESVAGQWFGLLPASPCKVQPIPDADGPVSQPRST
jgi:hypothetical protein